MPEFKPPKLRLGDLAGLETALCQQVADIRNERPLSPITILIENTMLKGYLRQCIASPGNGHINLQIITPARLADHLAREQLVARGRLPMPTYGDRILTRNIAENHLVSYFRPLAYSSGFAETLRGLFREFAQAGIRPEQLRSAVDTIAFDGTAKLDNLATLFEHYEQERSKFYSPDDLVAAVTEVDSETLRSVTQSPVIVYGIWNPSGIQLRMFERMMAAGIELCFYLPMTGTDVDNVHTELREWLAGMDAITEELEPTESGETSLDHLHTRLFRDIDTAAPRDGHVRLLSAPDAPREVREAARACLKWAEEGIPFHRMAVVYRNTDPYRTLIDQTFQRAGIRTYLHAGRPLIAEPSGHRLAALLSLIGADMPRASVMEFITETVLPEATLKKYDGDTPIQPARWDQITREAGIVQGRDQWLHRLELLETSKQEFIDPDAEVSEDDPLEAELREIDRFRQFIIDFADELENAPDEASWATHLEYLSKLARTYIDGIDILVEQLAALETLEQLMSTVSFERFRETVRFWLLRQNAAELDGDSNNRLSSGKFVRQGVNVLDIGSLRHLRFDAVIILGVAERQFPPPPRQDPLLLDRERARLRTNHGWRLPLRSQRSEEDSMIFAVAVQAAQQRLQISFPRSEAGSTRSYLPSHFFRAAASALTGENVEASAIDRLDEAYFTRVPAGSFQPPAGYLPLEDHEYDRMLLEQHRELGLEVVSDKRPGIKQGRIADAKRRSNQLTEFDGRLERESARQIARTAGRDRRPISPSRLETYATCPFRFFLQYVLQLEPVEEPETLERLGARERGALIHEILERFLLRLQARDERPDPGQRTRHLQLLTDIAEDACERIEATGLIGYPVIWEYDKIEIMEDLEEWYDREALDLAQTGLQPERFELRFGWARRKDEGGEGSRDEPFTLQVPGGDLTFQGRVDRVDIVQNGGLGFRVIDYKTGRKSRSYQPNTFNGGRSVQLPIYLMATSDLLDMPWETSEAQYFFPTRRGDFQRVRMSGQWLHENLDDFVELLQGILKAIENGIFPQVTTVQKQDNCRFCDYSDLCPVNVKRIFQRKQADSDVIWLKKVIEADA